MNTEKKIDNKFIFDDFTFYSLCLKRILKTNEM